MLCWHPGNYSQALLGTLTIQPVQPHSHKSRIRKEICIGWLLHSVWNCRTPSLLDGACLCANAAHACSPWFGALHWPKIIPEWKAVESIQKVVKGVFSHKIVIENMGMCLLHSLNLHHPDASVSPWECFLKSTLDHGSQSLNTISRKQMHSHLICAIEIPSMQFHSSVRRGPIGGQLWGKVAYSRL